MAPRASTAQRRNQSQSENVFELGKAGRKTGVTLRESSVRDEHGMEPLDVFSSPQKDDVASDEYDDSGEDMDIENTSGLGPAALLNGNGSRLPYPIPRSRSPMKTNLQSPARRTTLFGPNSLPRRTSPSDSWHSREDTTRNPLTRRKLDFGGRKSGSPGFVASQPPLANAVSKSRVHEYDEDMDDDQVMLGGSRAHDESMAVINDPGDDDDYVDDGEPPVEEEEEEGGAAEEAMEDLIDDGQEYEGQEEEPAPQPSVKRRANAKGTRPNSRPVPDHPPTPPTDEHTEESEIPAQGKKRGRPRNGVAEDPPVAEERPRKRRSPRNSFQDEEETAREPEARPKQPRGRPPKKTAAAQRNEEAGDNDARVSSEEEAPVQGRGRGRKQRISDVDTSVVIPRGPPLPKSRGLLINRRETPDDMSNVFRTRSGRNSFKPLAYWRNEHVDYGVDNTLDDATATSRRNGKRPEPVLLPAIKEVVRVDEPEPVKRSNQGRRGGAKKGRKGAKYDDEYSDDEPVEPWEEDPGTVTGDVVVWEDEHEFNPPSLDDNVELQEVRLAVAEDAVDMKKIKDATFSFGKTLHEPFFGTGLLDLPPKAVKKPKNSRKMYMAFFVVKGRVQVTVNSTTFRIRQGGTFFVPRGNYYCIENDYDQPARLFFSQGCETIKQLEPDGAAA